MKIAKTTRVLSSLENWQQLPNGTELLKQTQSRIDSYLPRCFGYHLLKLGSLSCLLSSDQSTIPHQINCAEKGDVGLLSEINHLPLQNSSIDLCILAHELDFSSDPHQLLREIDRVLTLDGTLIISGYNPISYLGLRYLLKPKHTQTARLFPPNRVIDWLHLLGFEIHHKERFGFSWSTDGHTSSFIESIGQRYLPSFCSVYFLVAKKQSIPMTPIKSPFKFKKPTIRGQQVATKSTIDTKIE
jgi:SAM-dependent methyltransferase